MTDRTITFRYTNYRGETAMRRVTPISIRWGSTEWHPDPQWLLLAHDHDKDAEREFALKDCRFEPITKNTDFWGADG